MTKITVIKIYFVSLALLLFSSAAFAYPDVAVSSIATQAFDGPAHYGLALQTTGIADPNLTSYELDIKEDTGNSYYPVYSVYNANIKPQDGPTINVPYRDGIFSLKAGTKYCVRIRAIYGKYATSWSEECNVTLEVPTSFGTDADGDGLTDTQEYALGTDPNNADSDSDEMTDDVEVNNGTDPNQHKYPHIIVRTLTINFGIGDAIGSYANQHSYIEIDNEGDDKALIEGIDIIDGTRVGSASNFKVGNFPKVLTNIAPQNVVRVPVSFIPSDSGSFTATVQINSSNSPTPIDVITLTGTASEMPDCNVTPSVLDFGTVAVNDQKVAVKEITISNNNQQNQIMPTATSAGTFNFSVTTTNSAMAPGIRAFILPAGKKINIPVLFQHASRGKYNSRLEVKSSACGTQTVELKGVAQ